MMRIPGALPALCLLFFASGTLDLAAQQPVRTESIDRRAANTAAKGPAQSGAGNPLWALPLNSLSATRNRPIFSSTRRPPPNQNSSTEMQQSGGPARPALSLMGAIVLADGGVAILLDETTKDIVRLQIGESHQGWTLESVQRREVTLKRDRQSTTLQLSTLR